ncbi:MAG TPA: hypothetical protein VLL27_13475 [Solirubrobacterales bacterium]|nr:hypothetical protein [Solirubrobacterales bacterium]
MDSELFQQLTQRAPDFASKLAKTPEVELALQSIRAKLLESSAYKSLLAEANQASTFIDIEPIKPGPRIEPRLPAPAVHLGPPELKAISDSIQESQVELPTEDESHWKQIMNHPWVIQIGSGVVVSVVGFILGQHF